MHVEGSAVALRSTWPLVLSREEGVRAAVVDTLHRLHVRGGCEYVAQGTLCKKNDYI
jgi:hypothetical protein